MTYEPRLLTLGEMEAVLDCDWHQDVLLGLEDSGREVWTLDAGANVHPRPIVHGGRHGSWYGERFGLPADLTGVEVLEVGTCDGLFAFEAESRRAKAVTALDVEHERGFSIAAKCRGSKVVWRPGDITRKFTLPRRRYDLVLCFGVLYHLTNPISALENLRGLTRGALLLETDGIAPDPGFPCWRVHSHGHDGDPSNVYYPNYDGLRISLNLAGFGSVERIAECGSRFTVRAS